MPITSDVDIFGRPNFGITVFIMNTFDISNNNKKIFCHGWIPLNGNPYNY